MSTTQEIITKSAGIEVKFHWEGDRYQYAFSVGEKQLIAVPDETIETPVFTDLHQQDDLLFLSGMSDDRHWSMSIEPSDEGFALDIAVRAKSSVSKIGSVYALTDAEAWRVTGVDVDKTSAPNVEPLETNKLSIRPLGDFNQSPITVRYRYLVEGTAAVG